MPYDTPKSRWAALQTRDALAASAFVYCVTTTKIFCRPNCPSRLARRANVEFHDTAADARAAGYRACMRCRPEVSEEAGDPQRVAIAKTCAAIAAEARGGQRKGVRELARDAGFTESHFCRVFKKGTGMTVGEYRASVGKKSAVDERAPSEVAGAASGGYDFDLTLGQDPQLDLELASGWFDFGRAPDALDYGLGMDLPGGLFDDAALFDEAGLFDEGYSHSNTESSLDTTPRLWPLELEDLQMPVPDQFAFVV